MKLYKNIDVVQIDIKAGVAEYFLPKNVSWAGKLVKNIFVYCKYPEEEIPDYNEYSPVDGVSPILDYNDIAEIFLDLNAEDGTEVAHNLCAQNLVYTNNNPIEINSVISLQLSRIFFAKAPVVNGSLILYVSWDDMDKDLDPPQKSVTVHFDLEHGKDVALADIIDSYIYAQGARVKGVLFWGSFTDGANKYITLRNTDYNTIINNLALNMCRPPIYINDQYLTTAETLQVKPLYLDCEDVDFANSFIRDTSIESGSSSVTLTFLY